MMIDPKDAQGEVFFNQLSRSQWREVAQVVNDAMFYSVQLTRQVRETLTEFMGLVDQFCDDDGTEDDERESHVEIGGTAPKQLGGA